MIEERTVCLFNVVPLFTENPAFVEDCFPTSRLGLLLAGAPALPNPIPAFTLKPFEFEEYSSLRLSNTRLFPTFRFRVSFAFTFAPIKLASYYLLEYLSLDLYSKFIFSNELIKVKL